MCSGQILAATPQSKQATSGGTPGSTPATVTVIGQSNLRAAIMFESAVGEPGDTTWETGNYVVRLNVTTAFPNASTWDSTYVCRCNSAGVNQATVGSLTGQTTDLATTGVKTHTVSGSSQSANAGDRIYIVLVLKQGSQNPQNLSFTPDQAIDTPIVNQAGCHPFLPHHG